MQRRVAHKVNCQVQKAGSGARELIPSRRYAHWNKATTTGNISDFNVKKQLDRSPMAEQPANRTWMCLICGWIYDEAAGRPEEGIAPGTRWEDVPINWTCPECGARKEDFEMVEV